MAGAGGITGDLRAGRLRVARSVRYGGVGLPAVTRA